MTTLKLKFTADPGHGWLHVKRTMAQSIMEDQFNSISPFSYQRGQTIYLEEDDDALRFVTCARSKGVELIISHNHTNKSSPIRSYQHFTP